MSTYGSPRQLHILFNVMTALGIILILVGIVVGVVLKGFSEGGLAATTLPGIVLLLVGIWGNNRGDDETTTK